MRKTNLCPKCGHNEILFIPQVADRDDKDSIRPLSLHVVHYDWKDDTEAGKLQAYVCRSCGLTELYAVDVAHLPVDKIAGAKILFGKK